MSVSTYGDALKLGAATSNDEFKEKINLLALKKGITNNFNSNRLS